jgi:Tol biopolymer transport system component
VTDLDHRLRSLDRIRPPDLWTDIRTREPDRHPAASDGGRRILAAGVALAVSAAAIGFAIRTFTGGDSSPTIRRVEILPTTGGKISFLRREETVNGYSEYLYSVEANGAGLAKVTDLPSNVFRYDWSPDGTKIVYDVGISEAEHEIRVLDLATGEETVVFHDVSGQDAERSSSDLFGAFEPAWSPDGTRIAFYSGSGDIYIISVDGSVSTQLTDPADSCGDQSPTWSPDGGSILFSRSCSTGTGYEDEDTIDLYVRDTDGTNEVRLTTGIKAFDPSWSPTGEVAFSGVAGDAEGIFRMEPDGARLTLLAEGENREPAWSPDGSRVAFVNRSDGDSEIHVIDADGSDEVPVTDNASDDRAPVWQPSLHGGEVEPMVPTVGTIALLSQRDDFGIDIALVQSDGTGFRALTNDRMDAGSLSWSPDGARIAFSVGIGEGVGAIRVLDVRNGGVAEILLVEATSPEHELFQPANPTWSPDGAEIWFTAGDGFYGIRPNGTGLRRLMDWDVEECRRLSPAWSPDRARVAFVRVCVNPDDSYDVPDTFDDLFVVNADGTEATRLTFDLQASDPMWSPDGTRIAFAGATDFLEGGSGFHRIYTINADGTGLIPITDGPADSQPAWSPDGTRIAFARYLEGNGDIYVMNADGTGLIRLTDEPGRDHHPVWRPDVGGP